MAGGTAVLTGMVAAPALLGGAIALTFAGRRMLKNAEGETEQIELAETQLEVVETTVDAILPYLDKTKTTLRIAADRGRNELDWIRTVRGTSDEVQWTSLSTGDQRHLERVLGLTALIFSILPLPVAVQPESVGGDVAALHESIRAANDGILEPTLRWLYATPA